MSCFTKAYQYRPIFILCNTLNSHLLPSLYFVGNLPNKISRDEVLRVVVKKLGKNVVTDLRLSLDENKRPRGFGYVELKDESMVEKAIADLNGLDVGEIKINFQLTIDYAYDYKYFSIVFADNVSIL